MADEVYSKHLFEIWLKQAHPLIKDWFQKEITYLEKSITPHSKVLDIGCGFGRHIKIIAPFSREVIGVDNNEDMIQKAKETLSSFKNVKLFVQDARKLSFRNDSFDYVICMTNTFGNFINQKVEVLEEMKRVCKKSGTIIISVYNNKALEIRKIGYEKVGLHITRVENGIIHTKECLVTEQFSKKQLTKLFDNLELKSKIIDLNTISFLCELKK